MESALQNPAHLILVPPRVSIGMSLARVKRLLVGWRVEPLIAMPAENGGVHAIWDFIPPSEVDASALRLTFLDGNLVKWDEAGPLGLDASSKIASSAKRDGAEDRDKWDEHGSWQRGDVVDVELV